MGDVAAASGRGFSVDETEPPMFWRGCHGPTVDQEIGYNFLGDLHAYRHV